MYTYDRPWSPTQRTAIESRGENVVVSAGAGSGKTSVLVERVVLCVAGDRPVDLPSLLIVTFTEAAAAEMRHRIRTRLHDLHIKAAADGDVSLRTRLARQLMLLDQAHVSTLHSFCLDVVRRNFLSLGLDPTFRIFGEDELVLLRDQVLQQLLDDRLADGATAPAVLRMLSRLGAANPLQIAQTVYRLDNFARSQPQPTQWLSEMATRFELAHASDYRDLPWTPAFTAFLDRELGEADDQLAEAEAIATLYEELQGYAVNLAVIRTALAQAAVLREAGVSYAAWCDGVEAAIKGSPRAGDHASKKQVQDLRTAAIKRLRRVLAVCGRGEAALQQDLVDLAPDMQVLSALVQAFQFRIAAAKLVQGGLDFSDLEHFALRALEDPETGEAQRLQAEFVEVFIDEYQDTSPIQDALVAHIARAKGNVFVVGDVKQSIYRFRMAEPNIFLDRYRRGDARVVDLPDNYRSRPEVVAAVNFVFSQLFSESFGSIVYDERAQMRAGADYPSPAHEVGEALLLKGPVEVHLVERQPPEDEELEDDEPAAHSAATDRSTGPTDGSDTGAVDAQASDLPAADDLSAIEKEALVIADRIRNLMGQSAGYKRTVVWDKDDNCYRPLAYRDIAVLMRSVAGRMNAVLEVFRRCGIPAYGQTSSGFYGSLEVKWLLAALSVMDNPQSDIELAAVLRSPLAAFTDTELALLRGGQRGSLYDSLRRGARRVRRQDAPPWPGPAALAQSAAAADEKAAAFLRQLDRWRTMARRNPAEPTLRAVLEETALLQYLAGMPGGDIRVANVDALLDLARGFDQSSVEGVHGFITMVRATTGLAVDEGEARTLGENEDVVRVTTIHKSKGLEYPVVFVADLGKQFYRGSEERNLPLHRSLGFGPQVVDAATHRKWRTMASFAVDEAERTEFLAEEARVLYVALTRARERLILVGSVKDVATTMTRAVERAQQSSQNQAPLSSRVLLGGKTYLDWLLPALLRHPAAVGTQGRDASGLSTAEASLPDFGSAFAWTLWNLPDGQPLPDASTWPDAQVTQQAQPDAAAPDDIPAVLAETAPTALSGVRRRVFDALSWQDRNEALRGVPGKVSATELRRLWVAAHGRSGSVQHQHAAAAQRLLDDPVFVKTPEGPTGRVRGIAFHAVMQHLDLTTAPSLSAIESELARIADRGLVAEDLRAALHAQDIVDFLLSDLGQRLRSARQIWREQPFFSRIDVTSGTAVAGSGESGAREQRYVVVQGVIDVLAREADGWLIVDYKTDRVSAQNVAQQAQEYSAQLATYMAAVQALVGGERVQAYTFFVEPHVAVPMPAVDVAQVFRANAKRS